MSPTGCVLQFSLMDKMSKSMVEALDERIKREKLNTTVSFVMLAPYQMMIYGPRHERGRVEKIIKEVQGEMHKCLAEISAIWGCPQ